MQTWPIDEVRRTKDAAGNEVTFWRKDDETAARLIVSETDAKQITAFLPKLDSSDMTRSKWGKVVVWTGAAVGALYAMIFWIVPALAVQLSVFIKPETEVAIGSGALRQIERLFGGGGDDSWFCENPEGQAAIDKMVARLTDGVDVGYDLNVRAVDHPMLNAFALPGGHVILMQGLLDKAGTADQVAGVLAHEIAHVTHRHPIEGALRAAGSAGLISLVLGDATGGTLIALVSESLVNASYTRAAEIEADTTAIEYMNNSKVSTKGFAEFFELLVEEYGDSNIPAWASTHPPSDLRAQQARNAFTKSSNPILTDEEWAAMKTMCD